MCYDIIYLHIVHFKHTNLASRLNLFHGSCTARLTERRVSIFPGFNRNVTCAAWSSITYIHMCLILYYNSDSYLVPYMASEYSTHSRYFPPLIPVCISSLVVKWYSEKRFRSYCRRYSWCVTLYYSVLPFPCVSPSLGTLVVPAIIQQMAVKLQ